jgi:hypothetical protein
MRTAAVCEAGKARSRARRSCARAHARRSLPLIILTPILALAGCGSSDNGVASKSGSEILAATRAAARIASSVHITATSSLANGKVKSTLDVSLTRHQGHARSSFLGTSYETIRNGDTIYVKGNQTFAIQLEHVLGVKVPAEVWLKGSATGQFAQLAPLVTLTTEAPLLIGGRSAVSKGPTTTVEGQPAITLKQAGKVYTGTLYVATTGQPYPLKLTKTGRETGQTTFTRWNKSITITTPANAIDISQLQQAKKGH